MSSGGRGFAASNGASAPGGMRSLRGSSKKPPPLMDPTRRRDGKRIRALFKPYRVRLTVVLSMIVFSAGLSMLQPFLLRGVLDNGLLKHEQTTLAVLVGGMIAIAIATGVFSVWQTYLSNQVGQRVMHDLRAAVYSHLQRMSLAFFTRTRTGEIQSRISNDIGGLDSVVTTTATTIAQNATTVLAAGAAVASLPAAVRMADAPRRPGPAQDHRPAAAPTGRHVGARLGVVVGVGDHARQDDGSGR
jgi:ABC-type multidrug transport system fused ATPase/permease subunit